MLINRLIKEVKFELKEAYRLLDELNDQEVQFGVNNDNLLAETTKDIITDQKKLLTNLKIDKLATIISKIEYEHVICPSCKNDLSHNKRVIRLPYYSLINIKKNPISPVEIIIIDTCQHCNYILDFEFFKGNEAHQLYQLLIKDLGDTEFELKEELKE
ncbi:hypothetical protein [Sporohalobacter salinus]|uniref:hypothetical protein n=1 Tax=Sporohalobacter salinus TaxID=1494606 RepID=UPI001960E80B|nr:hypothetical protein [Sporohalobacter salinus]MBM7624489.1 hypothetical protein [Sporohalobacter salinus]